MTVVRRCSGIIFSLVGIILMAGCGETSRNLPKSLVKGTVSYARSFPEGEVIFRHPSGEITVARFEDDGVYEVQVPQGKNEVMVRSQTSSLAEGGRPGAQMEVYTNHIPTKYNDFATSKLELEVKDGENTFDIKLTD